MCRALGIGSVKLWDFIPTPTPLCGVQGTWHREREALGLYPNPRTAVRCAVRRALGIGSVKLWDFIPTPAPLCGARCAGRLAWGA